MKEQKLDGEVGYFGVGRGSGEVEGDAVRAEMADIWIMKFRSCSILPVSLPQAPQVIRKKSYAQIYRIALAFNQDNEIIFSYLSDMYLEHREAK